MYPIIIAIAIADIGTLPLICWAWVRCGRGSTREKKAWFSITSLLLATSSALLAIGAFLSSNAIGGFLLYDRRLMRIYFYGAVLSTAGVVIGLTGLFFRNPVRWQAPVAAFGTLLFWLGCAAGE